VYARLRRLKELSAGFKAELDTFRKALLPSHPKDAIDYSKAINDALQAIGRAHGALQCVADRSEEVRRRGRYSGYCARCRTSSSRKTAYSSILTKLTG